MQTFASGTLARDPSTGELAYRQTFKLNSSMSEEDVYLFVQQWFTENPQKFMRQYGVTPLNPKRVEDKTAMEQAFTNNIPLQSLNPDERRVVGKAMVKYSGEPNSTVQLMYIEYYIVLETHGKELTASLTSFKYHHFNTRTYSPQVIYKWQNRKAPFDSADKMDQIFSSQSGNPDVTAVCSFLTGDMDKLLDDLKQMLEGGKALASK
jgi:hypothetical protein